MNKWQYRYYEKIYASPNGTVLPRRWYINHAKVKYNFQFTFVEL